MEYVKITNGKIEKIISTPEPPPDSPSGWREIDGTTFAGHVGQDERMIDWSSGKIRPLEELIRDGVLKDNRGQYWHKDTLEPLEIKELNQEVPSEFTSKKPPMSASAFWNDEADEWNIDREADEKARIQDIRIRRREEFQIFEKYQTVLKDTLTKEQVNEFAVWRENWLDAPETGKEPIRPHWFREY